MPSFKSKLFVFVLKYKHLFKGKLKRTEEITGETDIIKLRQEIEKGADFWGKLSEDISIEPVNIDELYAEWVRVTGAPQDKVILYFHGGGLVVGSVKAHRNIVANFIKKFKLNAFLFDYALAPENPFPAGLNDSIKVYKYLLEKNVAPQNIIFMGDSGGGNLVLSTLLALKEQNLPQPAGAVTLSAWTDLTNSGDSWEFNAKNDNLCWKNAQKVFAKFYANGRDPKNPLISPLFGDLSGIAPLCMFAGGHEGMLSDTTRFAEKAQKSGTDVQLTIGEGLFHCYPACAPMFPEAVKAVEIATNFIHKNMG